MTLFWEGYSTSIHHLRRYWRPVMLLAVPLVFLTAAAVATVSHALGLPWIVAWALGAVLSPTDAAAVAAYARELPGRWMTVLRGESLINDGTALALLGVVIAAAHGEVVSGWAIGGELARAYVVGAVAGVLAGLLALAVLRRLGDPAVNGAVAVALPFVAAVPAEAVHASGIVAVVACTLTISRRSRRITSGRLRLQAYGFLEITTFLLNGALFVLIGLQLRGLVTDVEPSAALRLVAEGVLLAVVVLAVRTVWLFVSTWGLRAVDRRPAQRELRAPHRVRVVIAWAGMRGSVSIAAALTIPATVGNRPQLLLLTFTVVAVTLLVQGATLPRRRALVTHPRGGGRRCPDGR